MAEDFLREESFINGGMMVRNYPKGRDVFYTKNTEHRNCRKLVVFVKTSPEFFAKRVAL